MAGASEGRVLSELGVDESREVERSCTKLERLREGCSASRIRLVRVSIASMGVLKVWGVRRLCHVGEGVERDAPRVRGRTALMLAAFNGKRDCLEALLQAGADKARAGCRCLHVGSKGGEEVVVWTPSAGIPQTLP